MKVMRVIRAISEIDDGHVLTLIDFLSKRVDATPWPCFLSADVVVVVVG